jgi:hypothetical protein
MNELDIYLMKHWNERDVCIRCLLLYGRQSLMSKTLVTTTTSIKRTILANYY